MRWYARTPQRGRLDGRGELLNTHDAAHTAAGPRCACNASRRGGAAPRRLRRARERAAHEVRPLLSALAAARWLRCHTPSERTPRDDTRWGAPRRLVSRTSEPGLARRRGGGASAVGVVRRRRAPPPPLPPPAAALASTRAHDGAARQDAARGSSVSTPVARALGELSPGRRARAASGAPAARQRRPLRTRPTAAIYPTYPRCGRRVRADRGTPLRWPGVVPTTPAGCLARGRCLDVNAPTWCLWAHFGTLPSALIQTKRTCCPARIRLGTPSAHMWGVRRRVRCGELSEIDFGDVWLVRRARFGALPSALIQTRRTCCPARIRLGTPNAHMWGVRRRVRRGELRDLLWRCLARAARLFWRASSHMLPPPRTAGAGPFGSSAIRGLQYASAIRKRECACVWLHRIPRPKTLSRPATHNRQDVYAARRAAKLAELAGCWDLRVTVRRSRAARLGARNML